MKPNTLLFTRDGTQIGNAIVVDYANELHTLLTDYGTVVCGVTTAYLQELFIYGKVTASSVPMVLVPKAAHHKHYTRRGRCKICGFHGCRILVNQNRECVDCYTTAAEQ